jgi:hypothetical protein
MTDNPQMHYEWPARQHDETQILRFGRSRRGWQFWGNGSDAALRGGTEGD